MANICPNVGTTKCGLRMIPHFWQWIWLILLHIWVGFPNVFSMCQGGSDISVAVYPEGTVKVPYGQPLEIFCVAEKFTSNDIEFASREKVILSEIVNSTTRRLYIPHPQKQVTTFYCRNKQTSKVCYSRVLIDSPPANVTDFSCISKNLDNLNCSWTSQMSLSVTNYSLKFFIDNNSVEPCNATKNGNVIYCVWYTNGKPKYHQMEKTYDFLLKSCNYFGCNYQRFTIDHFAVVIPDPPSNLKVLATNTHSVLLRWRIPNNIADLLPCGVDHRIEYQIAKIDNTSYFRSVDTSSLPAKNRTYKFLLSDLPYAHMQYDVRIYIKSKAAVKEEFWSDYKYIVFSTVGERPNRPPDTVIGAFHQSPYNTKRMIYIYWKQLEEYEEAGTNFTYKVITSEHNRNHQTVFADKNKSLSYAVLENASLDAINVSVWSINGNGSSINSSHIYIPPYKDTEALIVTSFTKLAYENGTYKLSWVGIKNIDSYTLFWCQQNSTNICAGPISFTSLNPSSTEHVIDLPRTNRYQFAISANNGTKTSGMIWAIRDIPKVRRSSGQSIPGGRGSRYRISNIIAYGLLLLITAGIFKNIRF